MGHCTYREMCAPLVLIWTGILYAQTSLTTFLNYTKSTENHICIGIIIIIIIIGFIYFQMGVGRCCVSFICFFWYIGRFSCVDIFVKEKKENNELPHELYWTSCHTVTKFKGTSLSRRKHIYLVKFQSQQNLVLSILASINECLSCARFSLAKALISKKIKNKNKHLNI